MAGRKLVGDAGVEIRALRDVLAGAAQPVADGLAGGSQVKLGHANAGCGDRHGERFALMQIETHRLAHRVGVRRERTVNVEIELVVARLAFDVVDVDMHFASGRRDRGSAAASR